MPRRLFAAVAVVLLAAAGWWWWQPTEEDRVRAQLERMASAVNGREGESDLERMARLATLASGLTPEVFVDAAGRRLDGREAVLAAARALAVARRGSPVEVGDVFVTMAAEYARADARVVVRIDDDHHELQVSFVQLDGTWLVDGLEAEQPLRRPGIGSRP